jgi:hypothetical protein
VGPQRADSQQQIHTPEAVFHVTQQRQPGRSSGARFRQIVMGENSSHHVFVDWEVQGQGDLFSDSQTAQQPQPGFRCFISTTAWMSSALGPFGPGLRRPLGENSMRYFCLHMAW